MRRLTAGIMIFWVTVSVVALGGCQRGDYRRRADRDVAVILGEKTNRTPWKLPQDYRVYPDPRSRFHDPTATDCPQLPDPQPVLNGYSLPPLKSGDPTGGPPADTPPGSPAGSAAAGGAPPPDDTSVEMIEPGEAERLPADSDQTDGTTMQIVPIPTDAWEQIPASCLGRMLEFASVRDEYQRSFQQPAPRGPDDIPRLTLENIMELALLNSRSYQTRKETLYATALALTQQRYQYQLRPTPFGNGSALNFNQTHFDGVSASGLSVPSNVAVQKSLATGGQFLASFANDVVLTFNGPQGFTADIGSALLFDFQQTLFQTDVQLEALTQTERDVVYAARDLVRFRRELFVDLASQYYSLLLSYRGIEIGSQDFFSNLRAFLQGRAEFTEAGKLPRVQVDQFEQNALRSRSDLVASCNALETDLDRLKLSIGLPPEMPLNLSLVELEALSAADRLTVAEQLVQRTRRELQPQEDGRESELTATINATSVLIDRLLDIQELALDAAGDEAAAADSGAPPQEALDPLTRQLRGLAARVAVLEGQRQSNLKRAALDLEIKNEAEQARMLGNNRETAESIAVQLRIYFRTIDLIESLLMLSENAFRAQQVALEIAAATGENEQTENEQIDKAALEQRAAQLQELRRRQQAVDQRRVEAIEARELEELSEFVDEAQMLLKQADQLASDASGWLLDEGRGSLQQIVRRTVDEVLSLSVRTTTDTDNVLPPIGIEEDPAMMTALAQRLDLMNQRAALADQRRAIKIAADDLRSILDLRATQIFRSDYSDGSPFNFSAEGNETRLSVALDTPLNRRQQRNNYRLALIDYNRTLRNLIERQDNVKFDVRQDLRQLRLRRDQYEIAIASAALAYERVVSTRLQLQYEVGNVVARDFLEAQQAYTAALSSVASQHISYILGRIELFFDLEGIELNENGFWPGVDDEDLQPPVNEDFRGTNPQPYDRLVPGLHYSDEIEATVRPGSLPFVR